VDLDQQWRRLLIPWVQDSWVERKMIKPSISLQKGWSIPLVPTTADTACLSLWFCVCSFLSETSVFFPRCSIRIPEMNIGTLQLCSNVKCCCFTAESSCSTSILTSGYLDGLIRKKRSQDATAEDLYVRHAVHEEGKGRLSLLLGTWSYLWCFQGSVWSSLVNIRAEVE
jgi:hypothetical protein